LLSACILYKRSLVNIVITHQTYNKLNDTRVSHVYRHAIPQPGYTSAGANLLVRCLWKASQVSDISVSSYSNRQKEYVREAKAKAKRNIIETTEC
jgi:hypothetical protein